MTRIDYALQRWRIRKASPFVRKGCSVLDIGSSDGALYRSLPNVGMYLGIDPLVDAEVCGPKYNLVRGHFPAGLPDEQKFDVITMLAVLEHIPSAHQETVARDCFRYLVPGGVLVATVPSEQVDFVLALLRLLRLIDGMSLEEHYGFKAQETPSVFEAAGFKLIKKRKFELGLNNLFVFKKPL